MKNHKTTKIPTTIATVKREDDRTFNVTNPVSCNATGRCSAGAELCSTYGVYAPYTYGAGRGAAVSPTAGFCGGFLDEDTAGAGGGVDAAGLLVMRRSAKTVFSCTIPAFYC